MTETELIERLISDIKIAIKATRFSKERQILRNVVINRLNNPNSNQDFSLEETWISLTCEITIPSLLAYLLRIINSPAKLLNFQIGEKIHLESFLIELESNKEKLSDSLCQFKNNPNLIFVSGQEQSLFSLLRNELEEIHSEALTLEDCYNILISK